MMWDSPIAYILLASVVTENGLREANDTWAGRYDINNALKSVLVLGLSLKQVPETRLIKGTMLQEKLISFLVSLCSRILLEKKEHFDLVKPVLQSPQKVQWQFIALEDLAQMFYGTFTACNFYFFFFLNHLPLNDLIINRKVSNKQYRLYCKLLLKTISWFCFQCCVNEFWQRNVVYSRLNCYIFKTCIWEKRGEKEIQLNEAIKPGKFCLKKIHNFYW